MQENVETNKVTDSNRSDSQEGAFRQIRSRFFRTLNYLSIYAFIIIVYSGALITDYILFALVSLLLQDDVQRYELVAGWFDYARIGLALLLIVCAFTHGVISTIAQVRLDLALAREGK